MIAFSRLLRTRRPYLLNPVRSISFSDFFGGGGHHGGGRGPPPDTEKFYSVLGVPKSATDKEIKAAYKKSALKHHPDKGGDSEKFKEISRAYEVLQDKEKRQVYDLYGEAGLEGNDAGYGYTESADPNDIFEHVFGMRRQGYHARMKDKRYKLSFSLEDLYKGALREVSVMREVVCNTCNGEGGKDTRTCDACGGRGEVHRVQNFGGAFFQQVVETCPSCKGRGKITPPGKSCKPCVGSGIVKKSETLTVDVPAGTPNGVEFRFEGKSDERPGIPSGDLVIVIAETKHNQFERLGADLMMQKSITLQDALCGFHFRVKFLDGENLFIGSKPGMVVKPGDVWTVQGKGMRKPHGITYGDLFITFDVKFPESVHSGEESRKLLKDLGIEASTALPENDKTTEASPLSDDALGRLKEKIRRIYSGL